MIITTEIIKGVMPCMDGYLRGCEEWPDGMELTQENLRHAIELDIGIDWFEKILAGVNRHEYFANPIVRQAKDNYKPKLEGDKETRIREFRAAEDAYRIAILPVLYESLLKELGG